MIQEIVVLRALECNFCYEKTFKEKDQMQGARNLLALTPPFLILKMAV
jgi:hypothetical protein